MPLAFAGAVLIGLSLGLLGSGGSILTVPVLTYLVGQDEKVAIAGSLAIVGTIALVAGVPHARRGLVDVRSLVFFGLPGMAGSYLGADLSRYVSGPVQMLVFAALLMVASVMMFRPPKLVERERGPRPVVPIAIDGLVVGVVTGFVGVGGGFLVVPALVLLGGLPIHRAVGTSLFIIASKSATGFAGYLSVLRELELSLDWGLLGAFAAIGILGSFLGTALNARVPRLALQRAFAVFLFVVGGLVVANG